MKKINLLLIILSLFLISATTIDISGYLPFEGWWEVKGSSDDLIFEGKMTGISNNLTGSTVFYYIDYTDLASLDGSITLGYTIEINDSVYFNSLTDSIILDHSFTAVEYGSNSFYKYQINGEDTIWRIPAYLPEFVSGNPAFKYSQNTADSGRLEYKIVSSLNKQQ